MCSASMSKRSAVPRTTSTRTSSSARSLPTAWRRPTTPPSADLVVVNTCAFIGEARQESIDTILALDEQRGADSRLVVTGCMAERYGSELAEALPEVDQVAGFGQAFNLVPAERDGTEVPVGVAAGTQADPGLVDTAARVRPAQPASAQDDGALGVRRRSPKDATVRVGSAPFRASGARNAVATSSRS